MGKTLQLKTFPESSPPGLGEMQTLSSMGTVSFCDNENILEVEVVVAQHWEGTKCHWTVHFNVVNFLFHECHLNKKCKET